MIGEREMSLSHMLYKHQETPAVQSTYYFYVLDY